VSPTRRDDADRASNVGTSEVSHGALQEAAHGDSIGVWVTAPTGFEEERLIRGMMDQIAWTVEHRISTELGVEALCVRRLRQRSGQVVLLVHLLFLGLAAASFYVLSEGTRRSELATLWSPWLVLVLLSIGLILAGRADTQPEDLSQWIRYAAKGNAQLQILYAAVLEVIQHGDGSRRQWRTWARTAAGAGVLLALVVAGRAVYSWLGPVPTKNSSVAKSLKISFCPGMAGWALWPWRTSLCVSRVSIRLRSQPKLFDGTRPRGPRFAPDRKSVWPRSQQVAFYPLVFSSTHDPEVGWPNGGKSDRTVCCSLGLVLGARERRGAGLRYRFIRCSAGGRRNWGDRGRLGERR
jgi:hypothetical protein